MQKPIPRCSTLHKPIAPCLMWCTLHIACCSTLQYAPIAQTLRTVLNFAQTYCTLLDVMHVAYCMLLNFAILSNCTKLLHIAWYDAHCTLHVAQPCKKLLHVARCDAPCNTHQLHKAYCTLLNFAIHTNCTNLLHVAQLRRNAYAQIALIACCKALQCAAHQCNACCNAKKM